VTAPPSDLGGLADVSRETQDRLEAMVDLLRKWNRHVNLVSPKSLPDVWSRHIADSAQLFDLAPKDATRWLDLGSGGGFPGLVCAILAAERRPTLAFTLIDADRRKCQFLQTVARELGLSVTVCATRAEDAAPFPADVVSARALAPLPTLFALSERFLSPWTCCLFPKGARAEAEIAAACATWRFKLRRVPSITSQTSAILCCEGVERAG
jgi:16S rRNA (guanine527-N7)-methyltransferase